MTAAADHTAKVKTASKQQVLDWAVNGWQKLKERKELITKFFQVTEIVSTDLGVVCNDDVLERLFKES